MSGRSEYGLMVTFMVIVVALLVFSWLTVEVSFPLFEYTTDLGREHLIPTEPFDYVAGSVSRFLWENRALDLMVQAFVIVVAVVCCLALLKPEVKV
jgi:hypothetical protein